MAELTTVKTIDIESLDDLFPGVDAGNVIVPEPGKKTVLSVDDPVDLDPAAIDKKTNPSTSTDTNTPVASPDKAAGDQTVNFDDLLETPDEAGKAAGRSKTDKSGIVELYKKKIEGGTMVPFDDYKEGDNLEEYLGKFSMK